MSILDETWQATPIGLVVTANDVHRAIVAATIPIQSDREEIAALIAEAPEMRRLLDEYREGLHGIPARNWYARLDAVLARTAPKPATCDKCGQVLP